MCCRCTCFFTRQQNLQTGSQFTGVCLKLLNPNATVRLPQTGILFSYFIKPLHREWKQQMSVTHHVLLIAEQDIWKQDLIFPVLRELLIFMYHWSRLCINSRTWIRWQTQNSFIQHRASNGEVVKALELQPLQTKNLMNCKTIYQNLMAVIPTCDFINFGHASILSTQTRSNCSLMEYIYQLYILIMHE